MFIEEIEIKKEEITEQDLINNYGTPNIYL